MEKTAETSTSAAQNLYAYLHRTSIVWKTALAAFLSWEIAKLFGSAHPYLAPLTVILVLQVTVDKSIKFAAVRVIGTIVGVLLTAFVAPYLGAHGWSLGLAILVIAGLAKWLKADQQMIHQIALSVLLVLYFQTQAPGYAFDRIRDTLIGAVLGVLINMLVFPPDFTKQATRSLFRLTDHLWECFKKAAMWLENGCPPGDTAALKSESKTLLDELHRTMKQLNRAAKNMRYHPFAGNKREMLQQLQQQFMGLRQGYAHLTGMIRTLAEWSTDGHMTPEDRTVWSGHMHTLASCIVDWKDRTEQLTSGRQPAAVPGQRPVPITLPNEMEKDRHRFALYNDAIQLFQDFTKGTHPRYE